MLAENIGEGDLKMLNFVTLYLSLLLRLLLITLYLLALIDLFIRFVLIPYEK
jgi:hypothetical protein